MKHKKMLLGLVLTLAMLAALAVTAYAASVTVKYRVYVYSDEITFRQYDYSQSTTPSITNLTIHQFIVHGDIGNAEVGELHALNGVLAQLVDNRIVMPPLLTAASSAFLTVVALAARAAASLLLSISLVK